MNDTLTKSFVRYVSSNVIGMLGLSCYILADTFFVARGLGENGLAALNIAIPVFSVINGVGLMAGVGGATVFSSQGSEKAFSRSVHIAAVFSMMFILMGIFAPRTIAEMLGGDERTLAPAADYLRILMLFSPLFMMNNIVNAFTRNDGAPRLAMAAMLAGSFANILLDAVFIFPLKLGMTGAALATGSAPIVGITVLSMHLRKKTKGFHLVKTAPSFKDSMRICAPGSSSFLGELSASAVIFVYNNIMLGISGSSGVAVYGIIANAALVATALLTGAAQGMQPLVSRNSGQKRPDIMKRILTLGILTGLAMSLLFYGAAFFFAEDISAIFLGEGNTLISESARGIRIYFICFIPAAVNITSSVYLSASSRVRGAFAVSFLRGFAAVIPAAVIMSRLLGTDGVWLSMPVAELITMILSLILIGRKTNECI